MRERFSNRSLTSGIYHQIDVSLAIARLDIRQTVPLFRQRSQTFGQQAQSSGLNRQFFCLGAEQMTPNADNVTDIQGLKQGINLISEPVLSCVNLDPSTPILDVKKCGFPHFADSHDSARYIGLVGQAP